jgi:hypothetical protein
MRENKQILFPFILALSLCILGCADFRVDKQGGVVSGCVDSSSKDRCHTGPSKDPQSDPPKGVGQVPTSEPVLGSE